MSRSFMAASFFSIQTSASRSLSAIAELLVKIRMMDDDVDSIIWFKMFATGQN